MKRILIKIGVLVFIIGGLVAVLWPVDTWRMYDANWQPLAMTEAEAWCAGNLLGASNFNNSEDIEGMEACFEAHEDLDNVSPRIGAVIVKFCSGLATTSDIPAPECVDIIEGYEMWPLQYGGYTWQWNDTNPRPEIVQSDISNAPRREGRTDDNRNETGRIGE